MYRLRINMQKTTSKNSAKTSRTLLNGTSMSTTTTKSLKSVPEAVSIIHKTKDMLSRGGLRLHKFVSNSKDVLSTISPDDRSPCQHRARSSLRLHHGKISSGTAQAHYDPSPRTISSPCRS